MIDWNAPGVFDKWVSDFYKEHGFFPDQDKNYNDAGKSVSEHMKSAEDGAAWYEAHGRPPTEDEWRHLWFKRNAPWALNERAYVPPPPPKPAMRRVAFSTTPTWLKWK